MGFRLTGRGLYVVPPVGLRPPAAARFGCVFPATKGLALLGGCRDGTGFVLTLASSFRDLK